MKKVKVTPEEKVESVKNVLKKRYTLREVADQYDLHHSSVEKWVTIYKTFGAGGFYTTKYKHYSEELKREVVEKYLTTDCSLQDICVEFKLRSISQVQKWLAETGKEKY